MRKITMLHLALFAMLVTLSFSVHKSSRSASKLFNDHKTTHFQQCPIPANATIASSLGGQNLSNVDIEAQLSKFGANASDDSIRKLRRAIKDVLDDEDTFTATNDSNYQTILTDLQSILAGNRDDIEDEVDIHGFTVDIDDPTCIWLQDDDLPDGGDNATCVSHFYTVEPLLMNFAVAANKEDVIGALYWILAVLPEMPSLSNICTGNGFKLDNEDFDDDDCRENIEDLADTIGSLQTDNLDVAFKKIRIRLIISDKIPDIVSKCFGTDASII